MWQQQKRKKEAIWLVRLIMEMGLAHGVINLHCDNQSALHLTTNQIMNSIVKHIDIMYHFISQAMFEKTIELFKIDGKFNSIDALTFGEFQATLCYYAICAYGAQEI